MEVAMATSMTFGLLTIAFLLLAAIYPILKKIADNQKRIADALDRAYPENRKDLDDPRKDTYA